MHFTKMQGLGNDYLYYYGELEDAAHWSQKLSDRHFGIGSDGIVTISASDIADFKMRIFNSDGSEALMCGNGIRCVGKYLYDKGYTDKQRLKIETLSGIKELALTTRSGKVTDVTVNMGKSIVSDEVTLKTAYGDITVIPVSVGNPHAVIFTDSVKNAPLDTVGKALERHEYFADGVNVEFVEIIDRNNLKMRVWERGSGITMACGTGACASVSAAVRIGKCSSQTDINVILDGGVLSINISDDNTVMMTGPAKIICECEVEDK